MSANAARCSSRTHFNPPRSLVITGASSGLGRCLALGYAAPGVTLFLLGRHRDRLAAVAAACEASGARTTTAMVDVGDAAAMQAHLAACEADQPVDVLIANAGISGGPQEDRLLDGLALATAQVRTNLLGVMNAVETLAPAMVARHAGQIALIASTAAYRGMPFMPAYAASKAGVRIYGEALRARLAPEGVAVSVVVPSFFDSPMTDRYHGAKPMMISTEAAATKVRRGLERAQARIVFPRRIGLLMQLLDLLPARMGDAALRGGHVRIDPPALSDVATGATRHGSRD